MGPLTIVQRQISHNLIPNPLKTPPITYTSIHGHTNSALLNDKIGALDPPDYSLPHCVFGWVESLCAHHLIIMDCVPLGSQTREEVCAIYAEDAEFEDCKGGNKIMCLSLREN